MLLCDGKGVITIKPIHRLAFSRWRAWRH